MRPHSYRTIFIKPQNGIGDLFVTIPLFHALRRAMPDCAIAVGMSKFQIPFGETLIGSVIDRIYPLPYKRRPSTVRALTRAISDSGADLVIDLTVHSYLPILGSRRRRRVIGCTAKDVSSFFRWLPRERLPPGPSVHRVSRYLQVLPHLGFPRPAVTFDFPRDLRVLESVRARLVRHGMVGPGLAGLLPQSESIGKSWPAETLQRTVDALVHDLKLRIVVIGGPPRVPLAPSPDVLDLRGQTTLSEATHLVRYSGVFDTLIGVDTGLMQVGGALNSDSRGDYNGAVSGNRTISLFGATDPERDRPYDPTGRGFNLIVQPPHPGKVFKRSQIDYDPLRRMYQITPEMVIARVEEQLSARHRVADICVNARADRREMLLA